MLSFARSCAVALRAPRLHPRIHSQCRYLSTPSHFMELENKFGAFNYKPLPVVLAKGQGAEVWDVAGTRYLDFLSAYSAVNQGHCHPRIVAAMREQAGILTLTSRAFHNDQLGPFEEYMHKLFGYDRVLPMNSGVEAGETAIKLTRKWAYLKKKVPANQARVIFARNNFWGRSLAAVSSSTDPSCYENYGPFTPGFDIVDYDNIEQLEERFKADSNVAGFYVEPIQGEAGVVVPRPGYLTKVRELCSKYNVLWIADEIQTGLGRTGKMLCVEHENVRPDIVVLGKALSGGMMPVSAVLCNDEVMLTLKPGTHGSTYGVNPLACRVAMEALQVIIDEKLCERSVRLGDVFGANVKASCRYPWVHDIRGKGLFWAIELDSNFKESATNICYSMLKKGLLAKQTHENVIRFAPPLVISDEMLDQGCNIISETFAEAHKKHC